VIDLKAILYCVTYTIIPLDSLVVGLLTFDLCNCLVREASWAVTVQVSSKLGVKDSIVQVKMLSRQTNPQHSRCIHPSISSRAVHSRMYSRRCSRSQIKTCIRASKIDQPGRQWQVGCKRISQVQSVAHERVRLHVLWVLRSVMHASADWLWYHFKSRSSFKNFSAWDLPAGYCQGSRRG